MEDNNTIIDFLSKKNALLLPNHNYLCVYPSIAASIGITDALIIGEIDRLCQEDADSIYYDKNYWCVENYDYFYQKFQFISRATIKRHIQAMEKSGLIVSFKPNESPYDDAMAYRVDRDKLQEIMNIKG